MTENQKEVIEFSTYKVSIIECINKIFNTFILSLFVCIMVTGNPIIAGIGLVIVFTIAIPASLIDRIAISSPNDSLPRKLSEIIGITFLITTALYILSTIIYLFLN